MKVYVFLADGFEEIEGITIIDVLRRAQIETETISITGNMEVTGAHGIIIHADKLFDIEYLRDGDMLVMPGGGKGTEALKAHKDLALLIHEYSEKGKYLAAVCAAPTVLGKLGILKGKAATCYPSCETDLIGAECKTDKVVQDGRIITSRGPGTTLEFALKLVEITAGEETSKRLRQGLLVG